MLCPCLWTEYGLSMKNVILFQISKQYYINEELNNTMEKESLSSLLSALMFVLWLKSKDK